MNAGSDYSPLRQVGRLMGVELLFDALALLFRFLPGGFLSASEPAGILAGGVYGANVYFTWTLRILRMVIWALILSALSRLEKLGKGFDRARVWYLLGILFFVPVDVGASVLVRFYGWIPESLRGFGLLNVIVFLCFCFSSETLCFSMGIRGVLDAAGELVDSFGLERQAKGLRRSAPLVAFLGLLLSAAYSATWLALYWNSVQSGLLNSPGSPEESDSEAFLFLLLLPLLLLTDLAYFIARCGAARRLLRAFRAIRELTE